MVPAILIYLLKANIALALFYIAYRLVLRRLTFYTLNRFFLLGGIIFSSLFPLIDITTFVEKHEQLSGTVETYMPDFEALKAQVGTTFTIWHLLIYIFWTGVLMMAFRLGMQLLSLLKIHRKTETRVIADQTVKVMSKPVNPFSFFRFIYINPSLHSPEDLRAILRHEQVHVRQWHTADVLLAELNNIFYWFNPGAWLMKLAIRENLEFITDRYMLQQGVDKKMYQYSLIKVSGIPYATAIANNFNFSHLKNRIMMMNKKHSSRYHLLRYVVSGMIVGGIVLSLNYSKAGVAFGNIPAVGADTIPGVIMPPSPPPPPAPAPAPPPPPAPPAPKAPSAMGIGMKLKKGTPRPMIIIDGKEQPYEMMEKMNPDEIQSVSVFKDTDEMRKQYKDAKNGVVIIVTKKAAAQIEAQKTKPTITLRRNNVLGQDNSLDSVLFIIDGVKASKTEIDRMDHSTIESMNVLKGESATSLYGSGGKHGVILVTTKVNKNKDTTHTMTPVDVVP